MPKVDNWQIATDVSNAIIRAQRQNSPQGFKDCVTRKICDILKLKDKHMNIYFIIVYQQKYFAFCSEMNGAFNPYG